ncbi:hypothetical protein SFUMM280S_06704 [Streptomyces fumanus]
MPRSAAVWGSVTIGAVYVIRASAVAALVRARVRPGCGGASRAGGRCGGTAVAAAVVVSLPVLVMAVDVLPVRGRAAARREGMVQ